MYDIYKNNKEHNPSKKRQILIVFHDMIAYILSSKKFKPILSELFIKGKLNISPVFLTQSRASTNCMQSSIRYEQKRLNEFT